MYTVLVNMKCKTEKWKLTSSVLNLHLHSYVCCIYMYLYTCTCMSHASTCRKFKTNNITCHYRDWYMKCSRKLVYTYKPVGRGCTAETSEQVSITDLVVTDLSCPRRIWFWGKSQIFDAFLCISAVFPLRLWNCWRTRHSDLWPLCGKTEGREKMSSSYIHVCMPYILT